MMKTKHHTREIINDELEGIKRRAWKMMKKSESDPSEDSSEEEVTKKPKKHKKKHDSSSDSDSDGESPKKRKHKKKKRKHSKKKRYVSSDESGSDSENDDDSSASEEDSPPSKKKHKHKHKHSAKHSKKRRYASDSERAYSEPKVVEKDVRSHKIKSICLEKDRHVSAAHSSAENLISSSENEEVSRHAKLPTSYDYNKSYRRHSNERTEQRPVAKYSSRSHHSGGGSSADREYYKSDSRNQPHESHTKYSNDKHGHSSQYYEGSSRRHDRGYNQKYENYSSSTYATERNGQTKHGYHKDKAQDSRDHNRSAGGSGPYNRNEQGNRYQGRGDQPYKRTHSSYEQPYHRHHAQEGGYQTNKEYSSQGNDHKSNRYQDRGDYVGSSGQQYGRRYDDGNISDRDGTVKREPGPSSPARDVKQERASNRDRRDPQDSKPPEPQRREGETSRGARKRPVKQDEDDGSHEWGRPQPATQPSEDKDKDKDKVNFGLSGKLTEDTNTVNGVVVKYSEPPEARQPKRRWRFYPFKGDKALPILYIHRQSGFLLGRDRKVADIPLDHPSVSKQHAALQYRLVPFTREDGSTGKRVRPYIIDLGSANGTFVNNKKVEPSKYVELLERDVVKFGFSQREYVLLHENSKEDGMEDDDVKPGHSDDNKSNPGIKRESDDV